MAGHAYIRGTHCVLFVSAGNRKRPRVRRSLRGTRSSNSLSAGVELGDNEERIEEARKTLVKAIALDDGLAEAHATLGNILLYHHWDFRSAERELKRAVQL